MDADIQQRLNQALNYHQQGHIEQAAALYRDTLNRYPDQPDVLHLLGVASQQQRNFEEAIALIERAIALNPNGAGSADYYNNCAEAYRATYQWDRAFAYYHQAQQLQGKVTATSLFNLGGAQQDAGQHEPAIQTLGQCIALQSDHARAHLRLAYSLLSTGEYAPGWRAFEWHVEALTGHRYLHHPVSPHPVLPRPSTWAPLAPGQSLVVLDDQGLGDELCMLRLVAGLQVAGNPVHYRATPKLVRLLKRTDVTLWDGATQPDHFACTSELGLLAGVDRDEAIPAPLALTPNAELVTHYRHRLARLPRPWIGLTWRAGTPENLQSRYKEAPLDALLNLPAAGSLIALQRNQTDDEAAQLARASWPTIDFSLASDDLEHALALMEVVDDYVAVSNTNVHLRASLGKASRVLTVTSPIDYRWPIGQDTSPWFPGSKAYRQSLDGSWTHALTALRADLTRH